MALYANISKIDEQILCLVCNKNVLILLISKKKIYIEVFKTNICVCLPDHTS